MAPATSPDCGATPTRNALVIAGAVLTLVGCRSYTLLDHSAPRAAATPVASHVQLGVHCTEVTPALAQTDYLPVDNGVRVATVDAGSVAEASGIEVGDVLLKYGDLSLHQISDLTAAIAATTKGADVSITVWRRTGQSVVHVRFDDSSITQLESGGQEQRPVQASSASAGPQAATPSASHVRLGVHCAQVTPELLRTEHLPADARIRVATVEAGSVAETAGIHVGDVLLKYGDHSLNEISDLTAAIAATTKGADVPITVWRRTGQSVVDVQF